MKIKDKISGEIYEAEIWKNWNGAVQYVKKGTYGPIRYEDDVEILEEDRPKDTTGWAAFRREAAKEMLPITAQMKLTKEGAVLRIVSKENAVKLAIEYADELIKQLKEEESGVKNL